MDYKFALLDVAIGILRPNAKYEISGNQITSWNDVRDCPTQEEIDNMIASIQQFESSNTIQIVDESGSSIDVDLKEFCNAIGI